MGGAREAAHGSAHLHDAVAALGGEVGVGRGQRGADTRAT